MNPEHRKYIEDNLGKKPVRQIAAELGLKERDIRKYLKTRPAKEAEPAAAPDADAARHKIGAAYILLLIVAILAVYANAIHGPYIFDDKVLVGKNSLIRHLGDIPKLFRTDIFCDPVTLKPFSNSYRPLQMVSYALDYMVWGNKPLGFHITNLLLHITNTLLVLFLLNGIFKNRLAALVVSLWFGISPVNTSVVSYISARADLLMAAFMLVSLILYIAFAEKKRISLLLISALSYLAAAYSREYAVLALPLLIFVYNAVFNRKELFDLKNYIFYIAAAVFYTATRAHVFHGMAARSLELAQLPLFPRVLTSLKTLFIDIRILFFPNDLYFGRTTDVEGSIFGSPWSFLTLVGIIAVICVLVYAYRKWSADKQRSCGLVFFGLGWFTVSMLPLINIYPLQSFLAESWLYLPSIGIYLIVAETLCHIKDAALKAGRLFKAAFYLILCAIFLCYGLVTVERNKDYRDELRFYLSNVKYRPMVKFYSLAGNLCIEKKDYKKALAYLGKAIYANRIYPSADIIKTYYELGRAYLGLGEYEKAKKAFEVVVLRGGADDAAIKSTALAEIERIKKMTEIGKEP